MEKKYRQDKPPQIPKEEAEQEINIAHSGVCVVSHGVLR